VDGEKLSQNPFEHEGTERRKSGDDNFNELLDLFNDPENDESLADPNEGLPEVPSEHPIPPLGIGGLLPYTPASSLPAPIAQPYSWPNSAPANNVSYDLEQFVSSFPEEEEAPTTPETEQKSHGWLGRAAVAAVAAVVVTVGGVQIYENHKTDTTSRVSSPHKSPTLTPSPSNPTVSPSEESSPPQGTVIAPNPDTSVPKAGGVVPRHFFWANVWGFSHTAKGGDKAWGLDGRLRMNSMAGFVEDSHADYGVFNEFEPKQKEQFLKVTGGRFGVVDAGLGAHNAIFYRKASFHLVNPSVEDHPIAGLDYYRNAYFNGHLLREPIARLIDNSTGVETDVLAIHNPANTGRFHHQEKWRDKATATEISVIKRLNAYYVAKYPGQTPRIIGSGDSNEHTGEFSCRMINTLHMVSSMGSSCQAARKAPIDEMMYSPGLHLSHRVVRAGANVTKATDHKRVYSAVITDSPANKAKARAAKRPEASTLPATESAWLADVDKALVGVKPYIRDRIAHRTGKPAINLDIDNSSLATYYNKGHAIPGVLSIAKYAHDHNVDLEYNTGRLQSSIPGVRKMLLQAGFPVDEVCGRQPGEALVHSKQRCRAKFIRAGQTIIANIGNNDTDFVGGNDGRAVRLPNYGGKLK
jgi:hypothetical protein